MAYKPAQRISHTLRHMEWKYRLFKRQLEKDLKFRKTAHPVPAINKAEHIGVLWTNSELVPPDKLDRLLRGWRNKGSLIEEFCFFPKLKKDETPPRDGITKQDVSWLGVPKWDAISRFVNIPFDLLIILDPSPGTVIEYIQAQSAARFKIGAATNLSEDIHLRIECKGDYDLDTFWRDLTVLLEKLSLPA